MPLFTIFEEQSEYLESLQSFRTGDVFNQAGEQSKQTLEAALANSDIIQPSEAVKCLRTLEDSPFSQEQRRVLAARVDSLVGRLQVNGRGQLARYPQIFMHVHRFLGQQHWDVLCDRQRDFMTKLWLFKDVLAMFGVTNPSPYAITHIIAILNVCCLEDPASGIWTINPIECYDQRRKFIKVLECQGMHVQQSIRNFPCTPQELKDQHPGIYDSFYKPDSQDAVDQLVAPLMRHCCCKCGQGFQPGIPMLR